MVCDCIDKVNERLAQSNGKLVLTFFLGGGNGSLSDAPTIMTEKVEPKIRVKPPRMIPTFCPFCGTRYEEAKAS